MEKPMKKQLVNDLIKPLFSLCLPLALCAVSVASDTADWQLVKPVELPTLEQEQLVALPLDDEIYLDAADDYIDVRILAADGHERPRLVEKLVETKEKSIFRRATCTIQDLSKAADNQVVLTVKLPEKLAGPVTGVAVRTPLRDFERSITVYARNGSGAEWQALVSGAPVYDYSEFADVRKETVDLPSGTYTELRLEIADVTDVRESRRYQLQQEFQGATEAQRTETRTLERRPLRVDAVEVIYELRKERVTASVKQACPATDLVVSEDDDGRYTVIDFNSGRQPLVELSIQTSSHNFRRPVIVQAKRDSGFQTLATDTVFDLSYRDFQAQDLKIEFPETRAEAYRIKIDNADNPPLEITGVELHGNAYRLVYLASPANDYRVFYKNPVSKRPKYDLTTLETILGKGFEPLAGELLPAENNPDCGIRPCRLLSSKWLFGAAVVIMVAVLAALLVSAGKKIGDDREPSTP
jgi:hypothetical protein